MSFWQLSDGTRAENTTTFESGGGNFDRSLIIPNVLRLSKKLSGQIIKAKAILT